VTIVVHSTEDLLALLRRGLSPFTDNREALLELGFERSYPQLYAGYESTIWERAIDRGRRADGYRVLARERAFLVDHRKRCLGRIG